MWVCLQQRMNKYNLCNHPAFDNRRLNRFRSKWPFHNHKPEMTSKGKMIHFTTMAWRGIVAKGPYI